MCVCVCVCVCVRARACDRVVAQLVRECIWSMETSGLQVQVTEMASYSIVALIKQETYTQLLLSNQESY